MAHLQFNARKVLAPEHYGTWMLPPVAELAINLSMPRQMTQVEADELLAAAVLQLQQQLDTHFEKQRSFKPHVSRFTS